MKYGRAVTKPVMEFFIKVRTQVRTYSGHGVQQYIHMEGDRGGVQYYYYLKDRTIDDT
jgi:hypothetical protein